MAKKALNIVTFQGTQDYDDDHIVTFLELPEGAKKKKDRPKKPHYDSYWDEYTTSSTYGWKGSYDFKGAVDEDDVELFSFEYGGAPCCGIDALCGFAGNLQKISKRTERTDKVAELMNKECSDTGRLFTMEFIKNDERGGEKYFQFEGLMNSLLEQGWERGPTWRNSNTKNMIQQIYKVT